MTDVRWKVYRFECPVNGCTNARSEADHHRRDPETMRGPRCPTHKACLEFVGTTDLYEREQVIVDCIRYIEDWGRGAMISGMGSVIERGEAKRDV